MIGSTDSSAAISPLYGRDRELRQIEKQLTRTLEESLPQALRVVARSGFGKTAFIETVLARARKADWLVFRAACHPSQQHTAVAALRRLVNTGLDALGTERERYVSGLESELASQQVDVSRYQTAVTRMFEGVLLDHAVIIAVDDAQWLDAETAMCLQRLPVTAPTSKVFFLFGDRREKGAPFDSEFAVIDLPLKALDDVAAQQIVLREYSDAGVEVAATIIERARGIPFDLTTLAAQAATDGAQSVDDVLKSVKTAIADQIQTLSAPVRDFLQLCSLIQEPIEVRILKLLIPDETRLLGLIESAVSRYLIAEGSELRFVHALVGDAIRSTILFELPLQKRVMAALIGVAEADLKSYDRIAHLAAECGEREMEYEYTVRLAHAAFAIQAFDLAIDAFERALRIHLPPVDSYVNFFNEYAMALRVTDRWAEARDVLEDALRHEICGQVKGLGVLANALVWCISIDQDNRHARMRYGQLVATMQGVDRLELLGVGAMLAVEPADEAALMQITKELDAGGKPDTAWAAAMIATGMLEACQGSFPEARGHLLQARTLMDPRTIRRFTTDVFELWIDFFEHGSVVSQEQIPRLLRRGQRDLPRAVAYEVLELSLHSDLARGRWEEGLANVQALNPRSIRSDSRFHALAVAAAIAAFTNRDSPYAALIEEDLSAAIRHEYRNRALELGFWWVAYLQSAGSSAAASVASKLAPWLGAAGWFSPECFFLPIAAFLYASRSTDTNLLGTLAQRELRKDRSPWHRAHDLLARGAARHTLGKIDGAEQLREAERLFRQLNCNFYAALTAGLLGSLGDVDLRLLRTLGVVDQTVTQPISAAPGKPKRRTGPVALTAREMQVTELVAEGYPNRRIAEELVLSERTVEAHIANVFSKLGISSRTQLARWIIERRKAVA